MAPNLAASPRRESFCDIDLEKEEGTLAAVSAPENKKKRGICRDPIIITVLLISYVFSIICFSAKFYTLGTIIGSNHSMEHVEAMIASARTFEDNCYDQGFRDGAGLAREPGSPDYRALFYPESVVDEPSAHLARRSVTVAGSDDDPHERDPLEEYMAGVRSPGAGRPSDAGPSMRDPLEEYFANRRASGGWLKWFANKAVSIFRAIKDALRKKWHDFNLYTLHKHARPPKLKEVDMFTSAASEAVKVMVPEDWEIPDKFDGQPVHRNKPRPVFKDLPNIFWPEGRPDWVFEPFDDGEDDDPLQLAKGHLVAKRDTTIPGPGPIPTPTGGPYANDGHPSNYAGAGDRYITKGLPRLSAVPFQWANNHFETPAGPEAHRVQPTKGPGLRLPDPYKSRAPSPYQDAPLAEDLNWDIPEKTKAKLFTMTYAVQTEYPDGQLATHTIVRVGPLLEPLPTPTPLPRPPPRPQAAQPVPQYPSAEEVEAEEVEYNEHGSPDVAPPYWTPAPTATPTSTSPVSIITTTIGTEVLTLTVPSTASYPKATPSAAEPDAPEEVVVERVEVVQTLEVVLQSDEDLDEEFVDLVAEAAIEELKAGHDHEGVVEMPIEVIEPGKSGEPVTSISTVTATIHTITEVTMAPQQTQVVGEVVEVTVYEEPDVISTITATSTITEATTTTTTEATSTTSTETLPQKSEQFRKLLEEAAIGLVEVVIHEVVEYVDGVGYVTSTTTATTTRALPEKSVLVKEVIPEATTTPTATSRKTKVVEDEPTPSFSDRKQANPARPTIIPAFSGTPYLPEGGSPLFEPDYSGDNLNQK